MAKQNVTIDNEYNSKKTNVIEGSVLVMTARPSTLMWKNKVMKATDMIMKTENLTNHASQCNHAFMPISFIDSCSRWHNLDTKVSETRLTLE
jgi:hypothetical protein